MDSGRSIGRDFDEVFTAEFPAIARAAWFVVLDVEVAKEIAQEAFCRALQRWDRVGLYERPGAWLRTVAIRLAIRSRDRRRREAHLSEVSLGRPAGDDEVLGDVVANTTLTAALATLPRQQRAAMVLRYLCDLSTDEVAAAIGCKPCTRRPGPTTMSCAATSPRSGATPGNGSSAAARPPSWWSPPRR